jgi:hypothetical protein
MMRGMRDDTIPPRWLACSLAILVCSASACRKPDSQTGDMQQPLTSFRQVLTSSTTSLELHPDQEITLPVQIQNPGSETWIGLGKYPVTVSYKWFDESRMLPIEGERTVFPDPIGPGATSGVDVRVVAPPKPGRYALRISLVQEGIAWFMMKSNMYLELPVTVN